MSKVFLNYDTTPPTVRYPIPYSPLVHLHLANIVVADLGIQVRKPLVDRPTMPDRIRKLRSMVEASFEVVDIAGVGVCFLCERAEPAGVDMCCFCLQRTHARCSAYVMEQWPHMPGDRLVTDRVDDIAARYRALERPEWLCVHSFCVFCMSVLVG